ncbi:MAG: hypothetical protein QN120_09560 [Armatimonadota bacterium]|nr:hypothetical protein [Armatimonadota bacterium]
MARPKVVLIAEDIERLPWTRVEGSRDTYEKILSFDPDTGSHTRLLKALPGATIDQVLVHDFWEETYILDGGWWEGDTYQGSGTYTCLPPGTPHGPYRTETGYLCLENRYYLPD